MAVEEHMVASTDDTPDMATSVGAKTINDNDYRNIGFWDWVRVRFLGHDVQAERAERLMNLTHAIQRYPETPTNYVLRGELYMEMSRYDAAYTDFETALELAQVGFQDSRWGVLSQAMQDRALRGRRLASVYLERQQAQSREN